MPSGAGLLQRPINEQIDELKSKIALLGKLKQVDIISRLQLKV